MKSTTKWILGLGVFAAATAAVTYAIVRELKAIRNLTINIDTIPDEDEETDELFSEEELGEIEGIAEDATADETVTD